MKTTFGVIVGNRDAFPDHLAKEGRNLFLYIILRTVFHTLTMVVLLLTEFVILYKRLSIVRYFTLL